MAVTDVTESSSKEVASLASKFEKDASRKNPDPDGDMSPAGTGGVQNFRISKPSIPRLGEMVGRKPSV